MSHDNGPAWHHSPHTSGDHADASRFIGIDVGAETIKVVEVVRHGDTLQWTRRQTAEHGKEPGRVLLDLLHSWNWPTITSAAVTGRLSLQIALPQVPVKQAQVRGYHFLFDSVPGTLISIGSHGYSVLELRPNGIEVFRENNRCSQGTGNFLRQLIERFSLTIEEASELCASVEKPAPLSGRCPVILKTDMTHLANKGGNRAEILAGLFDAICENVMVLVKPGISPDRVLLIGGVSQSRRVQNVFRDTLARQGMNLVPLEGDSALYFEALGSAIVASQSPAQPPPLNQLLAPPHSTKLEILPPLSSARSKVRRIPHPTPPILDGQPRSLILGVDIGSTGSKAVALDIGTREIVWEGYRQTSGTPVEASQDLVQRFLAGPASHYPILAFGVTGSGREIVGSLLTSCYGKDSVFILNEIAAHAEGAHHFDSRVDTIFEIGGQDAKYIRLTEGRVVDCAMNEACSAGTGSFIEEQGRKFSGIKDVIQLGEAALAAPAGVSLGQHCSVFMAEVIDEAVAAGMEQHNIIAGLYHSIIQNYLNRVKGSRSVGQVVFCQGMPFSSDALAAAVASQTGSQIIVPPNPGTVGALGIALLARRELAVANLKPIEPGRYLAARIQQKDNFICGANIGCGGAGNKCRIDRLHTVVDGQSHRFTWGGGCSLYDKGTRTRKLPNLAPDPFRERDELIKNLIESMPPRGGRPRVSISDEFMLKSLFPFFTTLFYELGVDLDLHLKASQKTLKQGVQEANVPFCAPMQLFHGLASQMAKAGADYIFMPMVRETPCAPGQDLSRTCPIVQAAPQIVKKDLSPSIRSQILSPVFDCGHSGYADPQFLSACRQLASSVGATPSSIQTALDKARQAQSTFDQACLDLGQRALAFCQAHGIVPVVVMGRPYTIYSTVLNSNVPAILREQGAIGIPVDCYPVTQDVPVFPTMYWGYGQLIMRAAHQVRRAGAVYAVYCSNYSCGPDSFCLHFFSYIMAGKPFAIIETDGHSGDAGTKTRIEAFLHCVEQDRKSSSTPQTPAHFNSVELSKFNLASIRQQNEIMLIPRLGPGSDALAACLHGLGMECEVLPTPDRECVRLGRRHTSGKECLPMCTTLGSLLKFLNSQKDASKRYAYLMPRALGPCRFGTYNLLNQITLERLGFKDRIRVWSPVESGYFDDLPPKFSILLFAGWVIADLYSQALFDTRPCERQPGLAQTIYDKHMGIMLRHLEHETARASSLFKTFGEIVTDKFFGMTRLAEEAAREFAAARVVRSMPTILLVGEIYVRCESFSNDYIVEKLEARGFRVRRAPFSEFMEYVDYVNMFLRNPPTWRQRLNSWIQNKIHDVPYAAMGRVLGWPPHTPIKESVMAAADYVRPELLGEAGITLGTALHEWREGLIDAVVSVGPLECMPNKVAEAQFFHLAEKERLPSLTLSLNGDPLETQNLENFAFEVHTRFKEKLQKTGDVSSTLTSPH